MGADHFATEEIRYSNYDDVNLYMHYILHASRNSF